MPLSSHVFLLLGQIVKETLIECHLTNFEVVLYDLEHRLENSIAGICHRRSTDLEAFSGDLIC